MVGKDTKAPEEHPIMEEGAVPSIRASFPFQLMGTAPGMMGTADLHLLGLIHLHVF